VRKNEEKIPFRVQVEIIGINASIRVSPAWDSYSVECKCGISRFSIDAEGLIMGVMSLFLDNYIID
jgi:hypothetical protein